MPRFPSEPPVYDSLQRHYLTLAKAQEAHLARAREYAEEEEWPYIPVTVADALLFVPVGFTQEDTPCIPVECVCGAGVHLQPGEEFECYSCSENTPVTPIPPSTN